MLMLVAYLLREIGVEQWLATACLPIVGKDTEKLNALCIVSVSCLLSRKRVNGS